MLMPFIPTLPLAQEWPWARKRTVIPCLPTHKKLTLLYLCILDHKTESDAWLCMLAQAGGRGDENQKNDEDLFNCKTAGNNCPAFAMRDTACVLQATCEGKSLALKQHVDHQLQSLWLKVPTRSFYRQLPEWHPIINFFVVVVGQPRYRYLELQDVNVCTASALHFTAADCAAMSRIALVALPSVYSLQNGATKITATNTSQYCLFRGYLPARLQCTTIQGLDAEL